MNSIEDAFDHSRALVFGVGGSGDIIGSIPTARLLESHGVDVTLGGIAWERQAPEPWGLDEFTNIKRLSKTVGVVDEKTNIIKDAPSTEIGVAEYYEEEIVVLDISHGIPELSNGLEIAAAEAEWDIIIGTDSGGDVLANGDEPGLRSPLIDGISLCALNELSLNTALGVFGYGCDGELTIKELRAEIARVVEQGRLLGSWGLSREVVDELSGLLEVVDTEASRLPVEAALGHFGPQKLLDQDRIVELMPVTTVTFYFRPEDVARTSNLVDLLEGTSTLSEANEALRSTGMTTEFPSHLVDE